MYILTVKGKENDGAYSVGNIEGEQVLYLFDQDYPEMHVIEVDDDLMLKTCNMNDYRYTVITKNDIVIPPLKHDDFI